MIDFKKEFPDFNTSEIVSLFTRVNYKEPNADTEYQNVELQFQTEDSNKNFTIFFNTGDPLVDWYNYYKLLYTKVYGSKKFKNLFRSRHSSSVDHWFMDSKLYFEKGLDKYEKIINDYDTKKDLVIVVTKEMKTMTDLRNYILDHKFQKYYSTSFTIK